ncbi:MAG: SpoIIE family protein phosphatase [candidate division KSB1 bacterium]|nr:SpoIIE family protein phosphatase [candidate division KSB1 bacterium]MDQ7063483.1 SpoIIE family protein phosphatase [candidate division KSB1 bacterium]
MQKQNGEYRGKDGASEQSVSSVEENGFAPHAEVLPYIPQTQQQRSGFLVDFLYIRGQAGGTDHLDLIMLGSKQYGVLLAKLPVHVRERLHDFSILKRTIRDQNAGQSPSGAIRALESLLVEHFDQHEKLKAAYAEFSPQTRTIRFATTANAPLFLFRQEHRQIYRLLSDDGTLPGTSLDEMPFRTQKPTLLPSSPSEAIRLEQHDLILMISDGFLAIKNTWGENLGMARLKKFLNDYGHMQPGPFLRRLQAEIEEFTMGEPLQHDVTVVAVKNMLPNDEAMYDETAVDLDSRFLTLNEEEELWQVSQEHPDLRLRELLQLVGSQFQRLGPDRIRFYLKNDHTLWLNGGVQNGFAPRRFDGLEKHFHQKLIEAFPIRQLLYRKYEFRGNTDAIARALEHYQNGHFQESLIEFVKVRKAIVENESVYCFFGNLYLLLNMTIKARQEYLKALRLNPRCVHAYLALAYIALLHKDYEGAIHYLSTAIRLDSSLKLYERFLHHMLAVLDKQNGHKEWIA